jgi:hypothetical protein
MYVGMRKIAHVTEFSILSFTIFRRVCSGRSGWRPSRPFATLVVAIAYAGLDVAIDALGAMACTVSCVLPRGKNAKGRGAIARASPSTSEK